MSVHLLPLFEESSVILNATVKIDVYELTMITRIEGHIPSGNLIKLTGNDKWLTMIQNASNTGKKID